MLARGKLDSFLGVAATKDLLRDPLHDGSLNLERSLRQPLVVHERATALRVMEQLRKSPLRMAVIVDEYGTLQGSPHLRIFSKRLRVNSRTKMGIC